MSVQRTPADAEYIAALGAQHLTNHLATVTQTLDDSLDRHAGLGQGADGGADHFANLPHGEAHGVGDAATGVLHQVPAVGDL